MRIELLTISGFRCFGIEPTTIEFSEDITTFVGTNGTGKTAALMALARMFGLTGEQRAIVKQDFYCKPEDRDGDADRLLSIEVRLAFPELRDDDDGESPTDAVPHCFKQMITSGPNGELFCRIRLEATWQVDGTTDGAIEQNLFWITSADNDFDNSDKKRMQPHERGFIQVHYIPASRDVSSLLRTTTKTMFGRLFRAIEWTESFSSTIKDSSTVLQGAFQTETAIGAINKALQGQWKLLYDDRIDAKPSLRIIGSRTEEIVKGVKVVFEPSEGGGEHEVDDLSEGQKSLFYLALTGMVLEVENDLRQGQAKSGNKDDDEDDKQETNCKGFSTNRLLIPALTVFALEEPENHLSPYYLSRIIRQVQNLSTLSIAQTVITSHSSSILGRVQPDQVRHFRLDPVDRKSIVKKLTLPDDPEELAKYVRAAIVAFPELYFARFVVFVEGDSEQIVIPRIAEALGFDVDPSFVAIVPLGGRHVNHFWRLLADLEIPYATLLDLDLGRENAGWGRVKYVCKQLIACGVKKKEILTVTDPSGGKRVLTDKELDEISGWDYNDSSNLKAWLSVLEEKNVFFSWPIDIDMAMLKQFTDAYKDTIPEGGGPRIPKADETEKDKTKLIKYMEEVGKAVFGEGGKGTFIFTDEFAPFVRNFPYYRYLFLNKSKPATHMRALATLSDEALRDGAPEELKRLIRKTSQDAVGQE